MKLIKIIILLIMPGLLFAKAIELTSPVTGESLVWVRGNMSLVVKDAPPDVEMVGKVRTTSVPNSSEKIIQILWTGVARKGELEVFAFDEPLLSTVTGTSIEQGTSIPFQGEEELIEKALQALKSGRGSKKKSKKVINPQSTARKVLMHDEEAVVRQKQQEKRRGVVAIGPATSIEELPLDPPRYRAKAGASYNQRDNFSRHSLGSSDSDIAIEARDLLFGKLASQKIDGDPNEEKKKKSSELREDEELRVEITAEGCKPRVDEENHRIIIQNKSITYKRGKKHSESECTDSLEHYLIKKDFLCSKCQDKIELEEGVAYPTFEKFWTNKSGERIVLSTQPEVDLTQKFPIIDEKGECEPYIDIDNMQAFSQVESVYFDRVNARIVVKACHRQELTESVPITLTLSGCVPTHDFDNEWSILQKKGIFSLKDKEYMAFGCKEVGRPIKHDFDTSVCSMSVDIEGGQALVLGKRYVEIEGVKNYLGDCEPLGKEQVLQITRDGCVEYIHSQEEGRSYLKKRWYFNDGLDKQFVTGCIKSTDYLLHKAEVTGYEHDDGSKKSKQKTTVYIEPLNSDRIDLYTNYINPLILAIPYALIKTKDEATESFRYEGCYKITQTNKYAYYKRPDESVYKLLEGIGTPHRGGDLCKRVTQKQAVYSHALLVDCHTMTAGDIGNGWETIYVARLSTGIKVIAPNTEPYTLRRRTNGLPDGYVEMHKNQNRVETTFPDKHKEYSSWTDIGEPFIHKQFIANGPSNKIALRLI